MDLTDVQDAPRSAGPPPEIALALAELGSIVLADSSLEQVLEQVCVTGLRAVPGAGEVSVTLVVDDRPSTAAFTGHRALALDERQYRTGFGPCLDAARGGEVMIIADMTTETRWPRYTPLAAQHGVASSLSLPLPVQEHLVGALNVYGDTAEVFDARSRQLGILLAGYAAVAVANAHMYATATELAEGMRAAMVSRAVIEQAKGILMAQQGCGPEEAFGQLTVVSQTTNRKLRDVAAALVARVQNRISRPDRHR